MHAFAPALALAASLLATTAATAAEAASAETVAQRTAPSYLVDVRPLVSWSDLGDQAPASLGLGLGGELRLGEKWYGAAEIGAWGVTRSDQDIADLADEDDDDPVVKRQRSGAVLAGLRYYGHPERSSWYAGGRLGAMTVDATYVVGGSRVTEKAAGIPLVFEGGYRWMSESGWLVRVGGRGGPVAYTKRDVASSDEKARRKVRDERPDFLPAFDLAVGYAW